MCNESPASLLAASNEELVPSASQMRCDGICPFRCSVVVHSKIYIIAIEYPPLVRMNGMSFELSRIRAEVLRLVDMNRRWCRGCIGDQQDTPKPQSSLQIHIGVSQVRTKIDGIRRRYLVHVNTSTWRRSCKSGSSRTCNRIHGEHALPLVIARHLLYGESGRSERLFED